jgi:hypothetical protein
MTEKRKLDPRAMEPESFEVEELEVASGGTEGNMNCPCMMPSSVEVTCPPDGK